VIRALLPIVYFTGLLVDLLDVSGGSIHQAWRIGLGPTILGLGFIGLLFCIPLALRIVRILNGLRASGSGGGSAPDDDDGFDADAAVARYLAQRSAEAAPTSPAPRPAPKYAEPARPTGFGRRIR